MKKFFVVLSLFAFVFAMSSCGSSIDSDVNKFLKMACEIEELQEKLMNAEPEEMEKLQDKIEKLSEKMMEFGESLEAKYEDDDEAQEYFIEKLMEHEC